MKFGGQSITVTAVESLPARGAWIEIVEIPPSSCVIVESLPARGAWIEIVLFVQFVKRHFKVAPRTGSVD